MTTMQYALPQLGGSALAAVGHRLWTGAAQRFRAWRQQRRTYDELMSLDDRDLADLQLQRSDIPLLLSGHPMPALQERRSYR